MFKREEIGVRCACDVGETVCQEHGSKRFLVPAGYYGEQYQQSGYYLAVWWTLRCEQCQNVREDFFVYKWSHDGGYPVDGSFIDPDKKRRYPDIYRAILNMLPQTKQGAQP